MKREPNKKIDIELAGKLAQAGSNGVQIAAHFGVHPDTLRDRIVDVTGFSDFSSWLQDKKAKGDSLLLTKQYDIAMQGDRTMLVWLGKQRLGQSDKQDVQGEVHMSVVDLPFNDMYKKNMRSAE
jgi:hypothetical protein